MLIANPIYDVVFKYMMEDNRVARLLIGKIIGEEILELEARPQEISFTSGVPRCFSVYRLDYSALVRTGEGTRRVIIEVQKAKLASDLMRFRRYLGKQYISEENYDAGSGRRKAIPIISIYFLGYSLPCVPAPVLKVHREYMDLFSKEIYPVRDDFVEGLTHDCYVVQIDRLKGKRRTELETLLSVFDQDNRTSDVHILNVREEDFPQEHRALIRRLQSAVETEEMREIMSAEDEIVEELADLERKADRLTEERNKALEEKDKALEEKDKAVEEKARALEEKNKAVESLKEKDLLIARLMERLGEQEH